MGWLISVVDSRTARVHAFSYFSVFLILFSKGKDGIWYQYVVMLTSRCRSITEQSMAPLDRRSARRHWAHAHAAGGAVRACATHLAGLTTWRSPELPVVARSTGVRRGVTVRTHARAEAAQGPARRAWLGSALEGRRPGLIEWPGRFTGASWAKWWASGTKACLVLKNFSKKTPVTYHL
jgi:hypothetical protein